MKTVTVTGEEIMTQGWNVARMPDQTGRTAVVTGANSGLGLETARALAGAGTDVVLACRSGEKGAAAVETIRRDHPGATLEVMALNLADLESVAQFAAAFQKSRQRLDLLINNAGVMALPEFRTAAGFEMQMGVNHLGHFALTSQLMPMLMATPGSRVVTVSSLAHKSGQINLEDLNWHKRRYRKWLAYGQSKLANLMFALELHRRLEAAGSDVTSVAAHPGYSATHLQLAGPELKGSGLASLAMKVGNTLFAQSQAEGALPSLYAATAPGITGGEFFGPMGVGEIHGPPRKVEPAGRALKREVASDLWEASEKLTGVRFSL